MSRPVTLPIPPFFDGKHASDWAYRPDAEKLAAAAAPWRAQHQLRPAAAAEARIHLLLIDVQKDFCFPEGTLYVAGRTGTGAIDDSRRIAELVYRNLGAITEITTTMDTHLAYQIFFPSFWLDKADAPLTAHRVVTSEQIAAGEVRPNPAMAKWLCGGNYTWLCKQVLHYTRELERAGKYQLYLWPPHCLLGSDGHALTGVVHEARLFHAFARTAQSSVEVKGGNPLTENYSVLRPEVLSRFDGNPLAQRNVQFIQTLLAADAVVIGGQAASHCVKSTIDDLLGEIVAQDPALAKKVYLLVDCMSAVTVPDGCGGFAADFTAQAEAALQKFADAGMHLVKSTDPMAAWPGLRL
ncbi:MAG: nicotinamidase [Deltaproteobacteria bacterium]|nr:nicotinamidase [Deltaproteobacteria bacterium]MCW5808944.1 nicotinamidase [Deltaproteobacteria bacterium]